MEDERAHRLATLDARLRRLSSVGDGLVASGVALFSPDEAAEMTRTYGIAECLPHHRAVAFDDDSHLVLVSLVDDAIVAIEPGSVGAAEPRPVSPSWEEWERGGFVVPPVPPLPELERGDVVLTAWPGVSDIVRVRAVLRLSMRSAELVDAAKNPPLRLLENVPARRFRALCASIDPDERFLRVVLSK